MKKWSISLEILDFMMLFKFWHMLQQYEKFEKKSKYDSRNYLATLCSTKHSQQWIDVRWSTSLRSETDLAQICQEILVAKW
jgi:hypothetical protein